MPLDRVGGVTGNGGMGVHCPGAYAHVLAKVKRGGSLRPGGWLVANDDAARLALFEAEQAARVAELIEQWRGAPVLARSYELPRGVALQRHFRGAPRSFVVTPDDIVTLRPKGTRP